MGGSVSLIDGHIDEVPMTDREKLIERLIFNLYLVPLGRHTYEEIADSLLANGVVVREKGEWVRVETEWGCKYACPRCGKQVAVDCYEDGTTDDPPSFCESCGADMRKGENDG